MKEEKNENRYFYLCFFDIYSGAERLNEANDFGY